MSRHENERYTQIQAELKEAFNDFLKIAKGEKRGHDGFNFIAQIEKEVEEDEQRGCK